MLDLQVLELLNSQVNKEFYSAYLYLHYSAWYTESGLDGFAHWYLVQTQEERDHALLFLQYLQRQGAGVALAAIARPEGNFSHAGGPLAAALSHERSVTESIHAVYAAAQRAGDFRTMQFLDWFVKEQGEEETNAQDLITKMELYGEDPRSLYLLDQEMAARVYTAPSLVL